MKKLLHFCLLLLGAISFGQTPLYQFNFQTASANIGTGTFNFLSSGTPTNFGYVGDRSDKALNAIWMLKQKASATLPNLPTGSSARTISCWVYHRSTEHVSLFSYGFQAAGQSFGLEVIPANNQVAFTGFGGATYDKFITHTTVLNSWTHYAVTFDGGNVRVYINGQLIGGPYLMSLSTAVSAFNLGVDVGGTARPGNIYFDELNIFSSALTPTQITTLFRQNDSQTPLQAGIPSNGLVFANHFTFGNTSDSSPTGVVVGLNNGASPPGDDFDVRNFLLNQTMIYNINNYGTDLRIGAPSNGNFTIVLRVQVDATFSNALASGSGQYITLFRNGSIFVRMLKNIDQSYLLEAGYLNTSNTFTVTNGNIGQSINGWNTIVFTNAIATNSCKLQINNTQLLTVGSNFVSYADVASQRLVLGITGVANQSFAGRLDDVLLYNRALSTAEINTLLTTLSSDSFVNNLQFKMYPNPANDMVSVNLESAVKTIEVYSIQGQMVLQSSTKEFSVASLNSGIYLVKVVDESGSIATQKLVKK